VEVICRRMGGGFGGKEGQASIFSQSAALAAHKLRAARQAAGGARRRHADHRQAARLPLDYDVGFDDDGRILGWT
jgi:xanthine dehydrogenase large subunit